MLWERAFFFIRTMEAMTTESSHHRWYESPRVNNSSSPNQGGSGGSSGQIGTGQLEGGGSNNSAAANSELNASVAEHMGAFFLDPSVGHQRAAARYYHQSMHSPYAGVGSHGNILIYSNKNSHHR